ncbi:MAG TPA: cupredoxin family copper-binding protein [Candidatus Saccharimonadales bacterium]|nr:cupredoxin family copper-binding protein [Candidatus Saccharimonadales bacterium]
MRKLFITVQMILTLTVSGAFLGLASQTVSAGQQSYASSPAHRTAAVQAAQQSMNVTIQNFAFSPANLTVPQGTAVTWTNKDSTAHTVTSDSGGPFVLNSGTIEPGLTFSTTLNKTGTFPYHCSIHPNMKGTITVTSASSTNSGQGSKGAGGASASSGSASSSSSSSSQESGGGNSSSSTQMSGMTASGPVAAGSGSVATASHRTFDRVLVIGFAAFIAAAILMIVRRLFLA